MNTGKIVQVIGPVVDVQFAEHAIPPIYQFTPTSTNSFFKVGP